MFSLRTCCCLSCGLHKLSFLVVFTSCLFLLSSHVVFALCLHTCLLTLNFLPHFVVVVVAGTAERLKAVGTPTPRSPSPPVVPCGRKNPNEATLAGRKTLSTCMVLLMLVDVGCILLYSVVLATFSTDVTIQRQNHFGHRSSSNVYFFYF